MRQSAHDMRRVLLMQPRKRRALRCARRARVTSELIDARLPRAARHGYVYMTLIQMIFEATDACCRRLLEAMPLAYVAARHARHDSASRIINIYRMF